jgi:ABC-type multidrug transport system fused ATPase/permease subunit
MVNDRRGTLYSHLQRLSLAFHSRQKVGDIMFRITADSFAVQTMLMNGLLPIISAIVLVAGMLLILFPLDPVLTMLSMSVVPMLFLLIALFNRRIADVATEVRDADSRVYSVVQWAISSMKGWGLIASARISARRPFAEYQAPGVGDSLMRSAIWVLQRSRCIPTPSSRARSRPSESSPPDRASEPR